MTDSSLDGAVDLARLKLLRSANLTVSEVCTVVGFESLGSFCTRFKQVTGQTPTEFRESALRGGPAPVPGCFVLLWAGGFDRADDGVATLKKPASAAGSGWPSR